MFNPDRNSPLGQSRNHPTLLKCQSGNPFCCTEHATMIDRINILQTSVDKLQSHVCSVMSNCNNLERRVFELELTYSQHTHSPIGHHQINNHVHGSIQMRTGMNIQNHMSPISSMMHQEFMPNQYQISRIVQVPNQSGNHLLTVLYAFLRYSKFARMRCWLNFANRLFKIQHAQVPNRSEL